MDINVVFEENYLRYRATCGVNVGYGETEEDAVTNLLWLIDYRDKYPFVDARPEEV